MTGNNLYGVLCYNQNKVNQGEGKVLGTHIILEPSDGNFNVTEILEDMLRGLPDRYRTEKPVLHISINPDPKDQLTDEQMFEISEQYMRRMGWGEQPYIVFKHSDIEREHIHIVSLQVKKDGKKINDSRRNERSWAIVQELEKEFGLHPAKGQKREQQWQFTPIEHTQGNLKKQISAVIKPAVSMYRFQTLGEFRALLSLYNIGIEEVKGTRNGQPYRGLLYTALDGNGKQAEALPLKSSVFGKAVGADALEKHMKQSGEKIEKEKSREHTRHRVAEASIDAPTEKELREKLQSVHIDLFLRRNDTGRITGVTFIDHENRCVLNGSRLGKKFSANVLNEKYPVTQSLAVDMQQVQYIQEPKQEDSNKQLVIKKKRGRGRKR